MTDWLHYPTVILGCGMLIGCMLTLGVLAIRRDLRDVDQAMASHEPVRSPSRMKPDFGLMPSKRPDTPPPAPPAMRTGCPARRGCPCDLVRRGDHDVPT